MYQDSAELRLGGGQLILGLNGLVFHEGHVLFLEEETSGGGLGLLLFQLPHPLVPFLLRGGLLLGPGLGLEAPPNVLAALSYPTGTTLADQVLILGKPC